MNASDAHARDVFLYLDNELKDQELEAFLAHLADCALCKTRLAEERELSKVLHRTRPLYIAPDQLRTRIIAAARALSAPEHAPNGLHRRVLRSPKGLLRAPGVVTLPWSVLMTAALMIVLWVVFLPDIAQRTRAASFINTTLITHRNYLGGKLPLEIESDSPETVTTWFAGKVPFAFRLTTSQSSPNGPLAYRHVAGGYESSSHLQPSGPSK